MSDVFLLPSMAAMPTSTSLPLGAGAHLVSLSEPYPSAPSDAYLPEEAVNSYGKDHEFTKLVISHKNIDPDDAFSTVPYEKGFHFVWYLDRLVGRKNFDKFIPFYFEKWTNKSLDSFDFKETFLEFFGTPEYADLKNKIASVDWESQFYTPGLPPKPSFDTSLADVAYALAKKWNQPDFMPSPGDVSSWTGNQILVFLNTVQDFDAPLSVEKTVRSPGGSFTRGRHLTLPQRALGEAYGLLDTKNVELKTVYYQISMRAKDADTYPGVAELLGEVGRMKFVRPLFKSLNKVDRDLALKTFKKNKEFYHPICRQMVEKDLGLA